MKIKVGYLGGKKQPDKIDKLSVTLIKEKK